MPTSTPSATSPFAILHAQLTQAILACRVDTAPKAVHTLRTTTRRLEGLLKKTLEDHPRATELRKTANKSLRQIKKVRQLAAAVRDLDVHMKLLKRVLNPSAPESAQDLALHHDQRRLHAYLEQKREQAAEVLASDLANREIRLERALEPTATALEELPDSSVEPLATARHWVEQSASQLYRLDGENLHDFRKQTKLARYVSEMQPPSRAARAFTRDLLAAQDAIGAWHDLHLLHQEAKAVCGKHSALALLLATRAKEALKQALAKAKSIHQPQQPARDH